MPVTRRLVSQDDKDSQVLRVDYSKRYLQNEPYDWQFLFGPNSVLSPGTQVLRIAAQLDEASLNKIRFAAYLYNQTTGNVDRAATCTFNVYRVTTPGWTDTLIGSFSGTLQPSNAYFYGEQLLTYFNPAELDGASSIMVEVVVTRLSKTFRDRIYLNHLGVYDSVVRLRQDVEFLDITKLDE